MKKLIIILFGAVFVSGCSYFRPDIMLKTPKDYVYTKIQDTVAYRELKISPNDLIDFRLFSNDGFKLIDLTSTTGNSIIAQSNALQYVIENEGTAKLPVLGQVQLAGMTIREAEAMLETRYSQYYVKPFVQIKVSNKRFIIFPGSGAIAKVFPLANNHTTLIEAIALAGGLPEYAKAYKIKIIRGDPQKPIVYLIDLSHISGIPEANMVVQPNDIIYVETRIRPTVEFIKELEPFLAIINSFFLGYTLYLTVKH